VGKIFWNPRAGFGFFGAQRKPTRDKIQTDRERHKRLGSVYDSWDDIPDMTVPTVYVSKIMALLNGFAAGNQYEPAALEVVKKLLLATFPLISRHLNDRDRKILENLQRIPSYLGGMGYGL
jgi:hypothetical protein